MFKKPLGVLGVFLIIVGMGYFVGAGVAYSKTQDGYGSLQAFSEAQNVQLSYNEDGQLIDRGTVEGAEAIRSLLEDDWNFPVVDSDLDPDDPLVNSATEYMFQMATIVYHVLNGEQVVTLTDGQIQAGIDSGQLDPDGTYNGVVEAYQGQVLTAGDYTVPVNGRYWTDFNRTDILDGPARSSAWSGTAHALVGELGVGAATHSTLQLALGVAALLAGLGVVSVAIGAGLLWHVRSEMEAGVVTDTVDVDRPDPADNGAEPKERELATT